MVVYEAALVAALGKKSGRSKSRPQRVRQEWIDLGFTPPEGTPNGRDWFEQNLNSDGLDELGYSAGLPGSHIAPDVQLMSEAKVARRNDQLAVTGMTQAQNFLSNASESMSVYRPGGAASLLSGLAEAQANTALQGNLARRTEAPNLMFRWEDKVRKSAEAKAKQGALVSSLAGLVGTVAGAALGGPIGALVGANVGTTVGNQAGGGGTQTYPGGVGATVPGGTADATTQTPGSYTPAQAGTQPGGAQVQSGGTQTPGGGAPIYSQQTLPGPAKPGGKKMAPGAGGGPAPGPGPGPGGGGAPGGGPAGGAPGGQPQPQPAQSNGVSARGGDASLAADATQAGLAMDMGVPADAMDALFWEMSQTSTLSTADIFDAELNHLMMTPILGGPR